MKGLDLLLESFVGSDLHLHVCQHLEGDFAEVYRKELTECPNIHVYGFVKMRSRAFRDLAMRCDWVISPTCAEGQPGAILECMAHGLIPILSREANIDVGSWGVSLPDCRIETLDATIKMTSKLDASNICGMSYQARDIVRNVHTAENFRLTFLEALNRCIFYAHR
jgi:hypothetical protein